MLETFYKIIFSKYDTPIWNIIIRTFISGMIVQGFISLLTIVVFNIEFLFGKSVLTANLTSFWSSSMLIIFMFVVMLYTSVSKKFFNKKKIKITTKQKIENLTLQFMLLGMICTQFLLFWFLNHSTFNDRLVDCFLGLPLVVIIIVFFNNVPKLKNSMVEEYIQEIYLNDENVEVKKFFEDTLLGKRIVLNSVNLTPKVEKCILLGIFETSMTMKKELFPNSSCLRIVISQECLTMYQKYKSEIKKS
ncbi:MAG: hypothetical protein FWH31_04845 [Streptococcaceae bacterium]|nr:hypothetical protein [Streptococcaceae bacterium]